ncbi:MAG: hypothetical protein HQL98_10485 [Magnetococcales bacterium]|nr:hypothetical protein [Magnetococcales bacterium]
MSPLLLDEVEEDAFKELFNISFGMTAATLSEMVDAEIELSVPCFSMLTEKSISDYIRHMYGMAVGLVGMRYRLVFSEGHAIPGMAVLLVRAADLGHFLDALHGGPLPESMAALVEAESMQLTGEILLYTCASSLSLLFGSEIVGEKPIFFRGDPEALPAYLALEDANGEEDRPLLMLRVDFALTGKEVTGSLLTWMDGNGLPLLKTEIDHFIAMHMA